MPSAEDSVPASRVAGAESGRRLLSVLLRFTADKPLWTVQELASDLQMSSSMVYRYIALLREVGLVDLAGGSEYRVTDRAVALAGAAKAAGAPLAETAGPVLLRLRDEIDETVLVARRGGWRVFTVDRAESQKPVRLQFEPGQAMTLHTGSLARVLLAAMPPAERQAYVASLDPSVRSNEHLTPEALDAVARDGWTESFEEIDEGIWGVAAPIRINGETVGALGCAAPIYRNDALKRARIRDLVIAGAAQVSKDLAARH
ncbi:IclR family transcriptional regulator [Microbacterium sp. NPDC091313]